MLSGLIVSESSLFCFLNSINHFFGLTDLGEFNHMIRKQLGIFHSCVCKFCENKRKQEADEEAAAAAV